MPQFQFAENFVPQLVWLAIFFSILYFGIVQLTLPKLGKTMTARENQVAGDIAAAESAKGAADTMAADYAEGIDAAHARARAAIAQAKGKASAGLEAKLAVANATMAEQAGVAGAALAAAREKALGEIESVAADAAADIVERLTGKRPDAALVSNAAKSALAA
jgi:F-type H+-transporting ATPase subunit b